MMMMMMILRALLLNCLSLLSIIVSATMPFIIKSFFLFFLFFFPIRRTLNHSLSSSFLSSSLDGEVKWISRLQVFRSVTNCLKRVTGDRSSPTANICGWILRYFVCKPSRRVLVCPSVNCTNSMPVSFLEIWSHPASCGDVLAGRWGQTAW